MFEVYSFNWNGTSKGIKIAEFKTFEEAERYIYRMKMQNKKVGYAIESEDKTWEY